MKIIFCFSCPEVIKVKGMQLNKCKKYNKTVVAVGGIHIDNASKEEIDKLYEAYDKMVTH